MGQNGLSQNGYELYAAVVECLRVGARLPADKKGGGRKEARKEGKKNTIKSLVMQEDGEEDAERVVVRPTLCYAIVPPGQKSGFWAGFRPDSNLESLTNGPPAAPAARRPTRGPIVMFSRLAQIRSGNIPARKH